MFQGPSLESREPRAGARRPSSRRSLLNWLLGGSFLSWAAVVLFPVLKYLKRPPEAPGGGQATLSDEDKAKVARKGFAIVRLGTDRVIVFLDSQRNVRALEAKCTHEGCTVTYRPEEGMVWCACHNGKFAIDGRVIAGPPPRPLAVYAVQGSLTSQVTVSRKGA
jgi:cytochrome b6-f complex iron-sulfur subunit